MHQKLKWSLILAGVIIVSSLAIWGVWVLAKSHRNSQKEKLNGKLIGWVIEASDEVVEEFAEKKGRKVLEDTALVTEITGTLTIADFTDDNVTNLIDAVADNVTAKNKQKITDLRTNSKIGSVKDKANAIKPEKIKAVAEGIIKDLTVKAVQNELEEKCKSAAKFVTKDAVKNVVEKGFDDRDDKINISKEAKKAAIKVTEEFNDEKFTTLKGTIKADAKESLKRSENSIIKVIIYSAIKITAGVSE
uniref:Crp32C n=2 Tax=Cotesia chilonis TaxID=89804 RepID=A0A411G5V0_9HYME|nr:Crp32C [Cotesia chilonis]